MSRWVMAVMALAIGWFALMSGLVRSRRQRGRFDLFKQRSLGSAPHHSATAAVSVDEFRPRMLIINRAAVNSPSLDS